MTCMDSALGRTISKPFGQRLALIIKLSAAIGRGELDANVLRDVSRADSEGGAELVKLGLARKRNGYLLATEKGLFVGVKLLSFADEHGITVCC